MGKNTTRLDREIARAVDSWVFDRKQIILLLQFYQNVRSFNLREESGNFKERLGIGPR